jgi:putative component of membrane protein insertase Oxa1/YidC/SpoIIIJ protein YidD
VRRCCAGINSAAIGNAAETTPPAPRPVSIRRIISCSAFCTSGISKVKNVVAITPI